MSPAKLNRPLDPAPETPGAILAAADAEIVDAQEAVTALTAAVQAGDDTVTQQAVEDAEKRLSWAKLRRAGADVKAAALADQQAKSAAAAAVATYFPAATEDIAAKVRDLLDQARGPIGDALKAVTTKNAAIWGLAEALAHNPQPENPLTFTDGRPQASWVQGPDGRQHRFTPGQALVRQMLDDVVRGL